MKILHYLVQLDERLGGVTRAVIDLSGAMARAGHAVTVVTHDAHSVPAEWRRATRADPAQQGTLGGTPAVIVAPWPALKRQAFGPGQAAALAPLLKSHDVLHLHGIWEYSNVQFGAAARRAGRPYIISAHGMLDDWSMRQSRAKKAVYAMLLGGRGWLRRAARVHCTAEAELQQAQRFFPVGRGVVVPLIQDFTAYRTLPGPALALDKFPVLRAAKETTTPVALFLSRVHPKKGVEHLIDAAALLQQRGVALRTLIAGPGDPAYIASLRERIAAAGLQDRVEFIGLVSGALKLSVFEAADVFVLPTQQENFGLVLTEALACGTPVITTKGVDIWPELERSGAAAITTADAPAVADAIQRALAKARIPAERERTRAWVMDWLNETTLVSRYEEMYQGVI
ncbi:glycosyltransferase [soil metagenome]